MAGNWICIMVLTVAHFLRLPAWFRSGLCFLERCRATCFCGFNPGLSAEFRRLKAEQGTNGAQGNQRHVDTKRQRGLLSASREMSSARSRRNGRRFPTTSGLRIHRGRQLLLRPSLALQMSEYTPEGGHGTLPGPWYERSSTISSYRARQTTRACCTSIYELWHVLRCGLLIRN